MKTIHNRSLFAALVCALLCLLTTTEEAAAQSVPPGSYQQSCIAIRVEGATLKAHCDRKADFASNTSSLANFFECDGDIWNN